MLLVAPIIDRVEELSIAPRSTAVLRRPVPLAAETQRPFAPRIAGDDFLDEDFMLPVVAEIISVREPLAAANSLRQSHRCFSDNIVIEVVRLPIRLATD